jgi:hypothetical protein
MSATHIFLCWDYSYEPDTIKAHREILLSDKSVLWGKFAQQRYKTWDRDLELMEGPLEEKAGDFAGRINNQIEQGIETRLYVCNPDPVTFSLHVAKLSRVDYTGEADLPGSNWCELLPSYYFKDGVKAPANLGFNCSYWFRLEGDFLTLNVDELYQLTDVSITDYHHKVNFSIPNFYPMPVRSSFAGNYFRVQDLNQPAIIQYQQPDSRSKKPVNKKLSFNEEHHMPKGGNAFMQKLASSEWIDGFQHLNGYQVDKGVKGKNYRFTEIDDKGDLTFVYTEGWTEKFKAITTAENRAEGQWIHDQLIKGLR